MQSGHGKLARQMTLLMAFADYLGNVVKVTLYLSYMKLVVFDLRSFLVSWFNCCPCGYLWMQDVVSAPRPCSPPVRRVTATQDEKEHALEYGLPSSHALMTVCLMGYAPVIIIILGRVSLLYFIWVCLANAGSDECRYMLHYVLSYGPCDGYMITAGLSLALLLVVLVGIGEFLLSSCGILFELSKITDGVAYLKL